MTCLTSDIPHREVEVYRKSLAGIRLTAARVDLEILIGLEVVVAANTVAQFLPRGHLRSYQVSSSVKLHLGRQMRTSLAEWSTLICWHSWHFVAVGVLL